MSVLSLIAQPKSSSRTIVLVGKESVGKSQLAAQLSGRSCRSENFRGSTVAIERYSSPDAVWLDTPGVFRSSDIETTRLAIEAIREHDTLLLVAQATQLDDDLADMLPLLVGKSVVVVVTFWDKVADTPNSHAALERLAADLGVSFLPVDARQVTIDQRQHILDAVENSQTLARGETTLRAGWRIEPRPGCFEQPLLGPVLALAFLILPAVLTICGANRLAGFLEPWVQQFAAPMLAWLTAVLPPWLAAPISGKFGLLSMGPFLLVWALPTVMLYALILGIYKATGLVERLNSAMHPMLRPFGLSGRDAVRVLMGLGCNVPAVIATRSCSQCSRGTAIAAISFGAACSYQLPATLAVLAAVDSRLGFVFLSYLAATTLIYLRWIAPRDARSSLNLLMTQRRTFLQPPRMEILAREIGSVASQFLRQALPVFAAICVTASWLEYFGLLTRISKALAPVMAVFDLPSEAALPVVMASLRKDGIFLFLGPQGLAAPLSPIQVLTGVYLAGVMLPCLVTLWTIRREMGWGFALHLAGRQAACAFLFAFVLAWGGAMLLDR